MGKSFKQGEDEIFEIALIRDGMLYDVSSDDVVDIQAYLVVGTWRSPMYNLVGTDGKQYLEKVAGVGNEHKIKVFVDATESAAMPVGSLSAEIITAKSDDRYPNDGVEIRIFKSVIGSVQKGIFI